jgi:hypothetical protein
VTYNHYLLHSYVGDSTPGAANGQAIQSSWYAITASGAPALSNG